MKQMTEAQAIEYIRTHAPELDYSIPEIYAVRGDDLIPKRRFRRSYNRPDGVQTTRLPGVCACYVAQNDMFGDYETIETLPDTRPYGQYRYLLQGSLVDRGNDEWAGEVIVADHKIIAQIVG